LSVIMVSAICSRHRSARPPHHVHRAPEQRPALEPGVTLVAALAGDRGDAEARLRHLLDGLDRIPHHGRWILTPAFDFGSWHIAEQEYGSSIYGRSRENSQLRLLHSPDNLRKTMAMTNTVLLAVCAVLIGFGILIIAVSSGFFMSLLGAGTMASGGSAAYLILSHRKRRP
jgi:hypothetical protein